MLGQLDVDVEERRYFTDRVTADEVRRLVRLLPGGVGDIVSTRGRRYREMGLKDADLSEDEWMQLLVEEPGLWRRPITIKGDEVVVGYDEAALRSLVE